MSNRSNLFIRTASATYIAGALFPLNAAAQDQDATGVIEEIVVTTQKREQTLQDVPITVTAYTGDFLETIGITEFDELSDYVPGLVVQEQSPNNPGFVIRGITSDSGSALIAPRVSIYLNGVDVSRSRGSYFDLFDIERVEVVKGPQSTLFGTAASIGAISVITRKPQQEVEAELNFSYGNYSYVQASGYVTGGTETWQARLAWQYKRREGVVDNIATEPGSQSENFPRKIQDLNGLNIFAVRPSVRFAPRDDVTIDLVFNYQAENSPGTSFKSGTLPPTGGNTSPYTFAELSGSPHSVSLLGDDLGLDRKVWDANATLTWDIDDSFTFTSISGYREFDSLEVFDADGSQANFLEFAEDAQGDQFSQEIRVNFDDGGPLRAFAGFNYFHEDGTQRVPFATEEGTFFTCAFGGVLAAPLLDPFPVPPCINPDGSVNSISSLLTGGVINQFPYSLEFTNYGNFDTKSFYIDASYDVSDNTEITAGVRFADEHRTGGFSAVAPNSAILTLVEQSLMLPPGTLAIPLLPVPDTGGVRVTRTRDFHAWLPRVNVRFDPSDDVSTYFTVSKGRRSPVLDENFVLGASNIFVPAEIIWNYEGGMKVRLFDRRVSARGSVFYQDYKNFQVSVFDDSGNLVSVNAGDASNVGLEFEGTYQATDELRFFGTAAYIDAKIDNKPTNGIFAGNRFRLQPKWSSSLGFHYERIGGGNLRYFLTGTWTYRSSVFFEQPNDPSIAQDSVNQVGLQAGVGDADRSWTLSGFVTNLFDEKYLVDAGNTGLIFGTPTFIRGNPRLFGVRASTHF